MYRQKNEHFTQLLPQYINGTLNLEICIQVRQHLTTCPQCQRDLDDWESISSAVKYLAQENPSPSELVLSQVRAKIYQNREEGLRQESEQLWLNYWKLVLHKTLLIRHGLFWRFLALSIISFSLILCVAHGYNPGECLLEMIVPIFAATGITAISEMKIYRIFGHVKRYRIPLTIVTRIGLFYGTHGLIAFAATATLCLLRGDRDFLSAISIWLGPMLLLSAFSLMISVLCGSRWAIFTVFLIWLFRLGVLIVNRWQIPHDIGGIHLIYFWETNLEILSFALGFLLVSLFFLSQRFYRQEPV